MITPTFTYNKWANHWMGGFDNYNKVAPCSPDSNSNRWFVCLGDFRKPDEPSKKFPGWRLPHFQKGDIAYISNGAIPGPKRPSYERPDLPPGFYHHGWFEDAFHRRVIAAKEDWDRRINALSRLDCAILGYDPDRRDKGAYKYFEYEPDALRGTCSAPGDFSIHESLILESFKPWTEQ